jgi:hypothetical protein
MKIYDYAARGRPTVATCASADGISQVPPHLRLGVDAEELAQHVRDAQEEPAGWAQERAQWAATQSWESRWPQWSSALFGVPGGASGDAGTGDPMHGSGDYETYTTDITG